MTAHYVIRNARGHLVAEPGANPIHPRPALLRSVEHAQRMIHNWNLTGATIERTRDYGQTTEPVE